MVREAALFESEILAKAEPRWLTFWGRSGTGKTMLARILYGKHPGKAHWLDWVKFCRLFQQQDASIANRIHRAIESPLLVVDDIGAEHLTPGTVGQLHGLLQSRLGKWTVITSNLSPESWEEKDARIGSRLIRGLNRHVSCQTLDFSTRPQTK